MVTMAASAAGTIKQAIQNYGVNSPFTKGIMQGVAEGNHVIPADWHNLTRAVLSPGENLQFGSWWQDHAQITANRNQVRNLPITMEQLLGIGPWNNPQDQMRMNDLAIEQIRQCYLMAWDKIESKGQISTSIQKILQGPKEPYTEFLAHLQEALKRQVTNSEVSDTIFQLLAYENANTDCKKAIGFLKGKDNVAEYIKAC